MADATTVAKTGARPPRRGQEIGVTARWSDEEIDLDTWAREYVRDVLEAHGIHVPQPKAA